MQQSEHGPETGAGLAGRVIEPSDCALAFGIPTSEEGFREHLATPERRDFVIRHCPVFAKYHHDFLRHLGSVEPTLVDWNVRVVHGTTLAGFGELFDLPVSVVTLFTHHMEESIELDDGLASIQDVVDRIPPRYEGFVDLCVCHPERLVLTIKAQRPRCIVRYSDQRATPAYWLWFYLVLFKILREQSVTYFTAVERTVAAMLGRRARGGDGCPVSELH